VQQQANSQIYYRELHEALYKALTCEYSQSLTLTRTLSAESLIQLNLNTRYDCRQSYESIIMSVTWTVSQTNQTQKYIKTFITKEENKDSTE
jgi:hypothetical protein